MSSVMFDKLWNEAFRREGELVTDATTLALTYKIASAAEAVKLARLLQAGGRSFFECCDAICQVQEARADNRVRRKLNLSPEGMRLLKKLLTQKAKKGW